MRIIFGEAEPLKKPIMCEYDEAFTIDEMLEETNRCCNCKITECPYCGKREVD